MKIYVQPNGVTLVGKAWQVQYMLKNYMRQHEFVKDWITAGTVKNK